MIDINELRRLAQAVVKGWSNCNQAWLDQSEDVQAAVVGHIDEDGNTYPVATIDCDQYYAAHQSLPLAKFYAAANPATVIELLDRLEAAEKDIALKERIIDSLGSELNAVANERDDLLARIREMERQKPVGEIQRANSTGNYICSEVWVPLPVGSKLYALPGAQPAPSVPVDLITDYLVSISAHVAHQEEPQAQAEIRELLRMLAATPEAKP